MPSHPNLHEDSLFPADPSVRAIARALFLARRVAEHRLAEDEATELATDLAYTLAKRAYKLDAPH